MSRNEPLPKKKSPTDATIRNAQASNKKFTEMKAEIKDHERRLKRVERLLFRMIEGK